MEQKFTEKEETLFSIMKKYTGEDVCIAFSGGTDSSLLLKVAVDCAQKDTKIYAVTFDTVLHPSCDLEIAKEVAKEMGAIHQVIFINELENSDIRHNPVDRCYQCKKMLFENLMAFAEKVHAATVLEGTNEDDLHVYRPGLKAVGELGVKSPLAEAGLTKQEVRSLAHKLGISVANRPAAPCLATRLPYGADLQPELLRMLERGETYLKEAGFSVVRLRLHGNIARIEIPVSDFAAFLAKREEITEKLKAIGFSYITLDMEGFRSGSMDETLQERKVEK